VLAASYPYLKRYTHFPQVYLGLAFGWGIPMAFAAIRGHVPIEGWLLYAANIVWATAYDTWYAMVDREDDRRMGSKSTALWFGRHDLIALRVLYAAFFVLLFVTGEIAGLGATWRAGLALALGLAAWEFHIARHRERAACFRAFLHNHWIGATVFAALALDVALR
jgi:4-hydroxybenzoate polyprenyltransferase